jgi:hypothetical protein
MIVGRHLRTKLQFISGRSEDGKQVQAQNGNEKAGKNVNKLAVSSDRAEDEVEIIEIMNSS